jgi:hypothetical protein
VTVTSFAELARTVAANWKCADEETKHYCLSVADILKERHSVLASFGGISCLPAIVPASREPKSEKKRSISERWMSRKAGTLQQHKDNQSVKLPIPIMSGDAPSETHVVRDQPSQEYLGRYVPPAIFPVAHEQGTADSHESRICVIDKLQYQQYQQHQQYQQFLTRQLCWATAMLGSDNVDRPNVKMLQPTSSGLIQQGIRMASMPNTTGSALRQTGSLHHDIEPEISAVFGMWLLSMGQKADQARTTVQAHESSNAHLQLWKSPR